ncbi:MBL fold metallo-hydrolase [bacterium]|nr:MBL fold metallo-hydrolase [bacterium]
MELKIYNTGFLGINTYLLLDEDSKEAVVIDLGGDYKAMKNDIDTLGYKLKFILNTHGHFDHLYGEVAFQKEFPEIPIYMHKKDMLHVDHIDVEMAMWGFDVDVKPITPSAFIDEDSELYIGRHRIQIFHTPGHSSGSLSYYVDGKLFSGDALFQRSIGRTDFHDGNYDLLINSIKTKLLTLNDDTVVYPGHGPKTSIKDEKKYNTYLN